MFKKILAIIIVGLFVFNAHAQMPDSFVKRLMQVNKNNALSTVPPPPFVVTSTNWTQVAPASGASQSLCILNGVIYGNTGWTLYKWDGVNSWVTVVSTRPGTEQVVTGLTVFNGEIYGGSYPAGRLYKWDGASSWVQMADSLNSQNSIGCLCVFNNELYGGTQVLGGDGGHLFKWNGVNAWSQVAPQLNGQDAIYCLYVFNNELYGSTGQGGRLFKWNGVNAWSQVAPQLNDAKILTICSYTNLLYGAGATSGTLCRWNGVNAWVQAAPKLGSGFGVADTINSLVSFNGDLYASMGHFGFAALYKFDRTNKWVVAAPAFGSEASVAPMLLLNNHLYGATQNNGYLVEF